MAKTLYLSRPGRLYRKQNTLYFAYKDNNNIQKIPIPIETIREIYFLSEIRINSRLLQFLGQKRIPVHVFSPYGHYRGSFYPKEENISGELLIRQIQHYQNPLKRLYLARAFIEGAIFHIQKNLLYYQRRGTQLEAAIRACQENNYEQLLKTHSIPQLMQIEGAVRKAYYEAFEEILDLEAPFLRERRPPTSPLNALLSFGYSLLYATTVSEIYHTPLHPAISYLHEPRSRRFSLALDLAEIFKPLIVDRLIFRLINKRMLSEKDFGSIGNARGIYLKDQGRKLFLKHYDDFLRTTIQHRRLRRAVSYRHLIRLEAYKLVKHLLGIESYQPLHAWW